MYSCFSLADVANCEKTFQACEEIHKFAVCMDMRRACVRVLALVWETPLMTLSNWVAHLRSSGVAARKLRKLMLLFLAGMLPRDLGAFWIRFANPLSPYNMQKSPEPKICPKFAAAIAFEGSSQGT